MKNEIVEVKEKHINIFGEDNQGAVILGNIEDADKNERIDFFNECLGCENSVSNHLNEKMEIKYIYVAKQEIWNEIDTTTGNPKIINGKATHSAPRMVFFTTDGKGYITFSSGIYNTLKGLHDVMGEPPYDFKIYFTEINKGKKRVLDLKIAKEDL